MNFFVYGTLMSPEVVEILIMRMPRHKPGLRQPPSNKWTRYCFCRGNIYAEVHSLGGSDAARVKGYRRHRIKGFVFPAMVPAEDAAEVQGLVCRRLLTKF